MFEVLYIHQTFTDCVSDKCILILYFNMPNVTVGYGRFSDLIAFFGEFFLIRTFLKRYNIIVTSSNFYKLCSCSDAVKQTSFT